LSQVVALEPRQREIHIIADNLSAHKTKRVTQFLADHPARAKQFDVCRDYPRADLSFD